MALVINNIVKMEWEKEGWLQKKSGQFIFASKVYKNSKGEDISVFFTDNMAFVWGSDEEGLWDYKQLMVWAKKYADASFPDSWDLYIPLMDMFSAEIMNDMLEKYGLEQYAEDIEARVNDLAYYGEEQIIDL